MNFETNAYQKINEVWVRESTLKNLQNYEGLILDVDGVLVDVGNSFRKTIIQTASFFCRRYLNPKLARKITPALVKKFKLSSGFNNDWELTYALILTLISYYENFFLKNKIIDFSSFSHLFLKEVSMNGGGLKGARKVFRSQVKNSTKNWERFIPFETVKKVFQEIYGGTDFCFELYGFQPELVHKKGLVNQEKLLVNKKLLSQFYPNLGLITGRTKEEVNLFLKKSSFKNLFKESAIIHDGKSVSKPHPAPLKKLMEELDWKKAVYLGDVLDDWLMVKRYCKIEKERKVFGGIITSSIREVNFFLNQEVDFVASSTESALNFLLGLQLTVEGRE